jgi:ankyrin repeat protein
VVLYSDSNGLTTPLCAATINCHKEIVDVLLAHGADVNLRDMSGKCAFDYSLDGLIQMRDDSRYGDHRAILRMLLESAKDLSCNFKIGGDNPLCRACAAGLYDVAEDLLGNKAFVECSSDVVMCDALAAACRKNDDRLVELLLKRGAKPNGVTSALQNVQSRFQNSEDVSRTLLHEAADKGNDKMVAMLIQAGANVRQADSCGNTALHAASNAAVALVLIQNGAVVNAINKLQWTPLYAACDKEHCDVMSTLLKNGANPNQSETAALLVFACEKNKESVVSLLLEHGADPNCEVRKSDRRSARPSVSYALCISCKKYNASIVGKLLSYGGRVSVVDSDGNSPLHLAISACCQTKLSSAGNQSTEVIDLLLSKSTSETLNIVNADGETPLCLAVRNGLHDVAVKLLERGADVNATSSDKHPLVIACEASNVNYGTNIVYGPSETKFADRKKYH